ncbi:MAG: hypothetical protein JKX80_00980 [Candidatus Pacebacteria bacterium]|nr:hypothetical protein [Candidatus Paceibacterota bacterium]
MGTALFIKNMFLNLIKKNERSHLLIGVCLLLVLFFVPTQVDAGVFSFFTSFADSTFANIITGILSLFVSLAGGLLALVGFGFDEVLNFTIINFPDTFSTIEPGVNAAWAGFRDVSNIVMIAMFVFVAFSVILNSSTYGLKQFGVRILIVAVLINFSLFFTKAIVDISNITAVQFRKAIQVKNSDGTEAGISAAFMQSSGITKDISKSSKATLDGLTEGTSANLGKAFVYTVITVIFFSALMAVLLYGLILLVTRMVTLIILMLLSSLAFTAYMIPGMNKQWDSWWQALIKNALFAPLFMMMLWATLNVVQGMTKTTKGKVLSFADVLKEDGSWVLIFNMMLVVGLLYASTKIANELSIKGAGFAKGIGMKGFSSALRLSGVGGALGLAGLAGRGVAGRLTPSRERANALKLQAEQGNLAQRMSARAQLAAAGRLGKAKFDFRDSKIAKNIQKSSGLNLGKGVGNFSDYEKSREKRVGDAADAAGSIAKDAAEAAVRGAAQAPIVDTNTSTREDMKKGYEENAKATKKASDAALQAQREANATQPTTVESGNVADTAATKASAGQKQQTALDEQDAKIKGVASGINEHLRDVINVASDIPSAGGLDDNAAVVAAIEGMRSDLSKREEAVQKVKSPKDIGEEAKRAFLEQYRDTGGIGQGGKGTRNRVAAKLLASMGKSSSDKRLEKIEKQLGDAKKGIDKLGED